jgi:hypothetical protein
LNNAVAPLLTFLGELQRRHAIAVVLVHAKRGLCQRSRRQL